MVFVPPNGLMYIQKHLKVKPDKFAMKLYPEYETTANKLT